MRSKRCYGAPAAVLISTSVLLLAAAAPDRSDSRPATAPAASTRPAEPFAVVFIDVKTERLLGPFPYDRSIYARAINKAASSGARGVILKFFIDQPKGEAGDRALVVAVGGTKVILQAMLDDKEAAPNEL